MTRSLEPDEESDEEFNYDEMDSQCDYLTKDVRYYIFFDLVKYIKIVIFISMPSCYVKTPNVECRMMR